MHYSTDIERLCKQLQTKSSHVSIYYEAGPCGYGLYLPNSFSPATAQDDALSGNVKINGIYRRKAIRSEVDVLLVGQVGTEVINGYLRDDTIRSGTCRHPWCSTCTDRHWCQRPARSMLPFRQHTVLATLREKESQLCRRVQQTIERFSGYSYVIMIGGGADIILDAVCEATGMLQERVFCTTNPQIDLVTGLYQMGTP